DLLNCHRRIWLYATRWVAAALGIVPRRIGHDDVIGSTSRQRWGCLADGCGPLSHFQLFVNAVNTPGGVHFLNEWAQTWVCFRSINHSGNFFHGASRHARECADLVAHSLLANFREIFPDVVAGALTFLGRRLLLRLQCSPDGVDLRGEKALAI